MYQNPVLFPQQSNRESFVQTAQLFDDQTGDLITLVDGNGNALYEIYLEISPERNASYYLQNASPYYDAVGEPIISATLSQGSSATAPGVITIPDTGTITIQVPYTTMQSLRGGRTYAVYLRLEDTAGADARQLLIGRLPVFFGGMGS